LRTIDRARIRLGLDDEEIALRRGAVLEQLDAFELIPLDPAVVERAAEPFPTVVGTLDALHLASALLARAELPHFAWPPAIEGWRLRLGRWVSRS
jgi:hypothetical protein